MLENLPKLFKCLTSPFIQRGIEDTEAFYFFVYRELPIDENNLSSIHDKP